MNVLRYDCYSSSCWSIGVAFVGAAVAALVAGELGAWDALAKVVAADVAAAVEEPRVLSVVVDTRTLNVLYNRP